MPRLHQALKAKASLDVILPLITTQSAREMDCRQRLPLHYAHYSPRLIRLLCKVHPDGVHHADDNGCLPIHAACRASTVVTESVELLMMDNEHPTDQYGRLPLHYAARSGNTKAIELLATPKTIHKVDCNNETPLHVACRAHPTRPSIIALLCTPQAARQLDIWNLLPIHYACFHSNDATALEPLIQAYPAGISTKMPLDDGLPLHAACRRSQVAPPVLEYLVRQYPTALRTRNREGWLPVDRIVQWCRRRPESRQPVIALVVEGNAFAFACLHSTCVATLEYLYEEGVSLERVCRERTCFPGPVWKYLLEHLPIEDTTLHALCCNPYATASALQLLLASVSVQAVDAEGNTALHYAVQHLGHLNLVSLFDLRQTNKSLLTTPNAQGNLPLHLVQNTDLAFSLLELYPCTIASRNQQGLLPVHTALCRRNTHPTIVYALMRQFPASVEM